MQTEEAEKGSSPTRIGAESLPKCPVCASPLTDLYPKPRCRKCGYLQSCCNPDAPDSCGQSS